MSCRKEAECGAKHCTAELLCYVSEPVGGKKGKATIGAVWIDCPYCGGSVSGADGSLLIPWNTSDVLTCDDCNKRVKMPKTATA